MQAARAVALEPRRAFKELQSQAQPLGVTVNAFDGSTGENIALRTAKALGLRIPPSVVLRADRIID